MRVPRSIPVLTPLLVLLFACAESPVGTEGAPEMPFTTTAAEEADLSPLARFSDGPPSILIAFAKKTIGPEGGSLRLLDFEIVVPAGAVEKDTEFRIRLPVDPNEQEYVVAEFGPHRTFLAPVRIRFPLAGTTIEGSDTPSVVWWDGSGWVDLESATVEDGRRLEAETDHFSTYGTADETALGEMSSGG